MKKYILIQNDGEIESNSFELIGASTKRGETGKIGFFGSGLKYSIAYMMRKNISFRIFSGEKELVFTTQPEKLKDQTFDRICINGKPTSYTITMGPTWTEDWFVLREIYCNAIDESNCQLIKEIEDINSSAGKTRIFIELTPSLQKVVDYWDYFFSEDRTPLFITPKINTSYIGNKDIDGKIDQEVTVFAKTEGVLFRKGIRCYTETELEYDYGLNHVNINEDRTASSYGAMGYVIANLMAIFYNEDYVKNILRNPKSSEYYNITVTEPNNYFSSNWVKFSKDNLLVVNEVAGKFVEQIESTNTEVFLIPQAFAKKLKKEHPSVNILGMGRSIGNQSMSDVEVTPKMNYLLKECITALKEMKYEIPYDITIVQFLDDKTLGAADVTEKKIYMSNKVFDKGKREICLTLMEETEHIFSGCKDETRAFQNHIFSQWLKSMEEANAIFL